jgi:hypothetical protein
VMIEKPVGFFMKIREIGLDWFYWFLINLLVNLNFLNFLNCFVKMVYRF